VNPAQEEDTNSGVDDGESAAANDDDSDDFSNSSFDDEISDGILPKADDGEPELTLTRRTSRF